MSGSPRSVPDWVVVLIAKAKDADGSPPFSDGALVEYRTGSRQLVAIDEIAMALVKETEAEFVVDPDARGRGHGTALLEKLLTGGATVFWAHGDHPAARSLAKSHGLEPVRELLHLSAELPTSGQFDAINSPEVGNSRVGYFTVGTNDAEWVALNALIFRDHAEQGALTIEDLRQLESEPWFRADTFLILREDDRMIGYCWLKLEGGRGEIYVVGVHPDYQGQHLGSVLFEAGLARLAELGIHDVHLYVEGDNTPALRLYHSHGFATESTDVQYSVSKA
jgi:mycothiol synthase